MSRKQFLIAEANHGQRQRVEPRHRDVQVQREGDAPGVQVIIINLDAGHLRVELNYMLLIVITVVNY